MNYFYTVLVCSSRFKCVKKFSDSNSILQGRCFVQNKEFVDYCLSCGIFQFGFCFILLLEFSNICRPTLIPMFCSHHTGEIIYLTMINTFTLYVHRHALSLKYYVYVSFHQLVFSFHVTNDSTDCCIEMLIE